MRIILASLGTDGDIFPYVGVGAQLKARGHQIMLIAGEPYRSLAATHGFAFEPLITAEETRQWLGHPDFWHPLKTAPLCAKWGARLIERQYALLARHAAGPDAVLVSQPAVFAATLVHEKFGTPLVQLLLQPGLIPSVIAPPVMPAFALPEWAPRAAFRLFWRGLDAVGDALVGRTLNRIRASLGLKPIRRLFRNWWAPQLVLGMFPAWYGPPQEDWPPQLRLLGFPLFDGGIAADLPVAVRDFCRSGPPPVAFTWGTGMQHGAALFRAALEACAMRGARGIFLTKYRDQLPDPLPAFVLQCDFAPFEHLFPLCAAVLHHGGVGTTARALAAATPQLIVPLAFDQMDNAARVRRLGAGTSLSSKQASAARIADALGRLSGEGTRTRCRALAGRFADRFAGAEPLEAAARCVEEVAERAGRLSRRG